LARHSHRVLRGFGNFGGIFEGLILEWEGGGEAQQKLEDSPRETWPPFLHTPSNMIREKNKISHPFPQTKMLKILAFSQQKIYSQSGAVMHRIKIGDYCTSNAIK
jgi:hypothetical protein